MKKINIKKYYKEHSNKIILFLYIFVCFFRIWLLYSTNWFINIDTYYDSHLQINQAISLINRNWLGGYSKFTLCKNPMYSIFVALLFILHIPYAYGIGLLMIATSFLFIKALKPILKNEFLKLGIFTLILYSPIWFEVTYHYRNALSSWLVLAVVACVVGIYLRKDKSIKEITPYSIIGLVSMGSFWLLREDSIWILPFVLVAYIIGIISLIVKKDTIKKIILYALISALPLCGIPIFSNVVSCINYKTYGVYATNDRMQTNIAKLIGTLIRIDDGSDLDEDVWISSKTIKLAKKVSPTFASLNLKPFDAWSKLGDHSLWAIRDVLESSGYFRNGKETDEVCGKIINELNKAFKEGKLKKKKGLQLSDTSGMFSPNEVKKSFSTAFESLKYHITYDHVEYGKSAINYSEEVDLVLYEDVLGINIPRNDEFVYSTDGPSLNSHYMYQVQNENRLSSLRHNLIFMNILLACYQHIDVLLFILGTIGFIYLLYKLIRKDKKLEYKFETIIIMIGLILLTYFNAYLVCLWAMNFAPGIYYDLVYNYTMVEYLLILLYEIFGVIYFIELVKEIMDNKKDVKKRLRKFMKKRRINKTR